MVKYLREVWQTSDGKVFGSEAEANYHEDHILKLKAVNSFRDELNTMLYMTNSFRSGSFYMSPSSQIEELLKKHGFTYTGKV